MAGTAATLATSVTAKTGSFERGMKRSRKSMRGFTSSVNIGIGSMVKFGAGLFAVSGALRLASRGFSTLKREVEGAFTRIDDLAKTSDKLGASTGGLASLQVAAKLSGVEIRTLNLGLQRMVRRMAEAAQGTGEAKSAIEELGLDAGALGKGGPVEAFAAVAKAMSRVQSSSDKLRLSFKLFDSEGVALVNTLRLMGDEWEDIVKFAKQTGIAISRIDARKIEVANDAVTKMKLGFDGMFNTIAKDLAPALFGFATAIVDQIPKIGEVLVRVMTTAGKAIELALAPIVFLIDEAERLSAGAQPSLNPVRIFDATNAGVLSRLVRLGVNATPEQSALRGTLRGLAKQGMAGSAIFDPEAPSLASAGFTASEVVKALAGLVEFRKDFDAGHILNDPLPQRTTLRELIDAIKDGMAQSFDEFQRLVDRKVATPVGAGLGGGLSGVGVRSPTGLRIERALIGFGGSSGSRVQRVSDAGVMGMIRQSNRELSSINRKLFGPLS